MMRKPDQYVLLCVIGKNNFKSLFFHLLRYTVYKDHIRLVDYEIHDGMGLELYYM